MFAALVGDKGYPISSEFWRQLLELPLTQKWPPDRVLQACHAFDQSVEYFLMKGVLDYIGSVDVSPESCYLHHELLNLMLVLVSTQLCSGPSPEPKDVHPFIDAAMLQEGSIVALVVQKLLLNFVRRPQIPSNGSHPVFSDDGVPGVLQRVGSAAANFVLLPYCILNYVASASAEGVTSQLADNSLLVLLILIHYQKCISMNKSILTDGVYMSDSNTKAKDTPAFHENPYCKSLNNVDRADVEGNAQNGPVVRLSFASLLDALVTCLKDESSALLFYSLVHGNCDFQEYVLVRTDLDTLLMPILEMLYNTSRKTSNQIYMMLIILLILSQDSTFNVSVHKLDVYLHTNCLAILANMGPHEHRLSAYASQRLVSLFDMLSHKYAKLDELKNDKALKVMSDQMEADIISDDTFNSQNSFISSQVGLGLAVQGPDSWHSKCEEQQGFHEGVSTEAATTTRANANTNEDDTETPSSNPSSSKGEGAKLSSGTRVSPKQHKKAMIHKARRIGRFSDPGFCSDHHLLSSRIAVACIPIQPEPMRCELLVPAMDSKGCVCKLMNDGTELDNFLTKYTSCGGQHPEFLEEAQNCSLVLPNEAAPMPAVPEIAPTQEVPEVVVLARKSKNIISLQWLWLLLLFVVLGGLLFCIVCELKKKREAGRVRPQSQDVQLTERVTVHPRQTADDMIQAGRVRPQSQDVQLTDRVTVHPRQTADDMIRNQHVEIPVIEELPFLGPNEAGRVRPQSQDVQLTDSVTMRPRQTADDMIRNQHVEIPVIEELPFLGPMTRSRFVAMKDKAVGTKESTSD